jgi:predicted transcriptional regulator
MCGIMISQKTKIVHRENYEIEIHNGNVAVYIHECNYDPYKIKIAVQIIDTFKEKIEKQKSKNGENSFSIEIETLQKINKEFQLFINKKNQHIAEIKNMYETLTKSAEDMEMNSLDELLESQGLLTNVKKFICGKCPRTFKTQKGLDTHQRQCVGTVNSKKGIQCEHCEEIIPTIKGLRTHCIKKHNIE